jgi:hypothetical protein
MHPFFAPAAGLIQQMWAQWSFGLQAILIGPNLARPWFIHSLPFLTLFKEHFF